MSETIKQNIKQFRLSANMTQAQVAEAMGVKQSTVSRWETPGDNWPDPPTLERLAELFGRQPVDFFAAAEQPELA